MLIYRERGEEVQCRQIGLHCPPIRVWGFEFAACGNHECRPSPYDCSIRENKSGIRMICRLCNWCSALLRLRDADGMISRVNSTVPNMYWHEYPASMRLQDLFVRATCRKERSPYLLLHIDSLSCAKCWLLNRMAFCSFVVGRNTRMTAMHAPFPVASLYPWSILVNYRILFYRL